MALAKAMTEQMPQYGEYVHFGATSQDVLDTCQGLTLKACKQCILEECEAVRRELTQLARAHRDVPMIGRTHGQHASPITVGFKFAAFLYEVTEAARGLEAVDVAIGKISGATGTYAAFGTMDAEAGILEDLGLHSAPICTQVLTRLHPARYVFALACIAAAVERLAREIRNLQRPEIGEFSEAFGATQVGSSTMPHKRNPHKSERVCSVARFVRGLVAPALETVELEHERDLTNSAIERINLPTATTLTHYVLSEIRKILAGLVVHRENIDRNLHLLGGAQIAERLMIAMVPHMGRQGAHEKFRTLTGEIGRADEDGKPMAFEDLVRRDPEITGHLSAEELSRLLDPRTYIGFAAQKVDRVIAQCGVE
eukprot:gnl/Trimastix_PCT/1944.p2 GENE.gnl/Trimastix_PCT/1944~~gnl/Trimastix_PCT/1944.p2  ORF type:complete len:369 (+),score=142.96 gnl/Trimastix_PCT/1944:270-1376(+)